MYGRTAQGSPFKLARDDPIFNPLSGKPLPRALPAEGFLILRPRSQMAKAWSLQFLNLGSIPSGVSRGRQGRSLGLYKPSDRVQFPAAPFCLIRRSADRSNTDLAHDDVLPSAALSSILRSAGVRQILSMFV